MDTLMPGLRKLVFDLYISKMAMNSFQLILLFHYFNRTYMGKVEKKEQKRK